MYTETITIHGKKEARVIVSMLNRIVGHGMKNWTMPCRLFRKFNMTSDNAVIEVTIIFTNGDYDKYLEFMSEFMMISLSRR